jgi:hypothetical protein
MFGAVPAAQLSVVSDTQLTAVVPPHATGTVTLVVSSTAGSSGGAEGATYFNFVGYRRYQETEPKLGFAGSWQVLALKALSGGSSKQTKVVGASMTVHFEGQGLKLVGSKGPKMGKILVSVDGGKATTVDLYAAKDVDQQVVWFTEALKYGKHTVVVSCAKTATTKAKNKIIRIDAVDVMGTLY